MLRGEYAPASPLASGRRAQQAVARPIQLDGTEEETGGLATGQWTRKVVALSKVAPKLLQMVQLVGVLDPFGHHLQVQRVRKRDDCLYNRGILRVLPELVDLQNVDREALEVGKRRVASAAVIDGELDAQRFELAQRADGTVCLLHQHAFGDLQLQAPDQCRSAGELPGCPPRGRGAAAGARTG